MDKPDVKCRRLTSLANLVASADGQAGCEVPAVDRSAVVASDNECQLRLESVEPRPPQVQMVMPSVRLSGVGRGIGWRSC